MKSTNKSIHPFSPDEINIQGEHKDPSKSHNNIEEYYLNQLSPEVRQKIRELEHIPIFPKWPIETRGVPNLCLRSALFGVIKRGRRRAVKGEMIAAVKGVEIRYTGWQLDQADLDVLVQSFHLQNHHNDKTPEHFVLFQIKTFLRSIGRQSGKSGREWLKDCFRRLTASAVEITVESNRTFMGGKLTYAGSLVDEFYYDEEDQLYLLKMNPKLAAIFNAGWTQLQWCQRLELKTNLAKWLHGFYASHRSPFPIKVITLKTLCGSDCNRLTDFRKSLRTALKELVVVGAIKEWKIDDKDKVHVVR